MATGPPTSSVHVDVRHSVSFTQVSGQKKMVQLKQNDLLLKTNMGRTAWIILLIVYRFVVKANTRDCVGGGGGVLLQVAARLPATN